jgi:RNA polymerase sigma-70 factor (ECF subfamily)
MEQMSDEASSESLPRAAFPTTRWSVVLAAKKREQPESVEALETLCRNYWYPLYVFVRSSGWGPADAEDLTQEFFARLLEKNYLRVVEPQKGRFRTFLRFALKRFLAKEWDRIGAAKRGSGRRPIAFDAALAEERFCAECGGTLSPEQRYDRQWALSLLNDAVARLAREYEAGGKGKMFAQLRPYLMAERGSIPYGSIATALDMSESTARVTLHRLRKRFREVFRETVADTVGSAAEAENEIREVLAVLSEG